MATLANPEMLILARESRGLNQTEMAEAISVTQGKISKYENGMLVVSEEDLDKYSESLGYTKDFFYQQDQIYGLGSSFLFHRQRKNVPLSLQKQIQAQINILRIQIAKLLRATEIEADNDFNIIDIDYYNGKAQRVAELTRAAWRLPLGPVANVTAAIESAGGIVLKCAFGTKQVDAAHLWLPGLPPLFFVNKDLPGDRLRWTLAHEAGHAVMHRNPTENVEEQANTFASEFLMPEREIAPYLPGMTLERAAVMKPQWGVSMQAIIKRARDLDCITERKYRSLLTSLSAQGYKTNEPFPIPVEEPHVARQLVDVHRRELGYDDFDLAKLFFWPDPQFFAPGKKPTILKLGVEAFFAFFTPQTDPPKLRIRPGDQREQA